MAAHTIKRTDLCDAVCRRIGLSRSESASIVNEVIAEIMQRLENGENVKLSSFGTFVVRDKDARIGRNPKTGDAVPIAPRRVVIFRASNVLKRKVNFESS